ncbi:class I SAM-dependent methyltransferase [Flavobacteriaceae bacterium AU392]|nr:class I SAM-dependent methyltransferase [Flavobacteriaceae bacterium]RKM82950.1 class I SAM-dependent methyltransferase [Flavobacteriaceae bacterium AU392]
MFGKLKKQIKSFLNKLPYIKTLYKENQNFKSNTIYPAGHYYSTIISIDEVRKRENEIWKNETVNEVLGVDLNIGKQLQTIQSFEEYYDEIPFEDTKKEGLRYFFKNGFYSYSDAISLYGMIRNYKPKKIIEAGSGYSSALMLDVNACFFQNQIDLTFIEPYPERLYDLILEKDKISTTIIESFIQNVPINIFESLESGDILFIDSTHVSKTGSDVNFILFEILPRLKSGVLIHFHDIFYPFEYPKKWVFQGRNWNEDYIVKAFLMYNKEFEILFFSHYLHKHHKNAFKKLPLMYNNHGGNLWLIKK